MRTVVFLMAGWTSIALGAVFLPLPTPFGVPLFVIGASLLLMVSPAARTGFKNWRTLHRKASNAMLGVESWLPRSMRKTLEETHPDDPDERSEGPSGRR